MAYPGHDPADGRCERRHARHFQRPRARAGGRRRRFRPALSQMASRPSFAARPDQQDRGFRATANGKRAPWMRDTLDVYAFHVTVPQGVTAIDVDFQYLSADRREPGAHRRHARHGEHPVDRQFDVPRRLLRARHPGTGVGDRSGGMEGGDRASAERADRQPHRLSGDRLRDPDGFAADRRRSFSPDRAVARRRHRRDRRQ